MAELNLEALVESLGGPHRASLVADNFLRLWLQRGPLTQFGVLEAVVTAQAAVNLLLRPAPDLVDASSEWLRAHDEIRPREHTSRFAKQCVVLVPKGAEIGWTAIRDQLIRPRRAPEARSNAPREHDLERSRAAAAASLEPVHLLSDHIERLAGSPQHIFSNLDSLLENQLKRDLIESQAMARVWAWDMLTSGAATAALGVKPSNRQRVHSLRRNSQLLGIPRGSSRFLFPAFQFSLAKRELNPTASAINQLLGSADDPWGVASWWVSRNGWLPDSGCPAELLISGESEAVLVAARSEYTDEIAPDETAG